MVDGPAGDILVRGKGLTVTEKEAEGPFPYAFVPTTDMFPEMAPTPKLTVMLLVELDPETPEANVHV